MLRLKISALAEPVLVGRKRELDDLMRSLDSAFNGKGTTVFVSGEAGSGKTRLANEFLRIARKKDATVLYGWCLSDIAEPYFPFIQAFKSFSAEADCKREASDWIEVNAWLTGLKQIEKDSSQTNLSPQVWKDLTFEFASKTLLSMAAENPTILFIEDIHWADSMSLGLLHYVSRTMGAARLLILVTYRSEELTADTEGCSHLLAEELRLMRAENLIREIKLTSLNRSCVVELAGNLLGGRIAPELSTKLSEESRGNPLFVVESIRMLSERRGLCFENDQWHLTVGTLGIPDKFRDIVLRRLAPLSFNQRRVLDAASVLGEKFDLDLLSAVLRQDSLDLLEVLNTIARSTCLLSVEGNYFRFDHSKSREIVYDEIALPLRRGIHKRVAEKLEATPENDTLPLGKIAYHYAEAGIVEKAIKFSMEAGQNALARFSNTEAINHFTYVLEKETDTPENTEAKLTVLEALGDAYFASCLFARALDVFGRLATSTNGVAKLRAYRKAMDAIFFGKLDDRRRLMELARKAEPYAASSRLESARILFLRARKYEEYEEALQVFEEEYSPPDTMRALTPFGATACARRLFAKGLSAHLRAVAMLEEVQDLRELARAYCYTGRSFLSSGQFFHEAGDMLIRAIKIGERIGDFSTVAQARLYMSILAEGRGNFEEAVSESLKALEHSTKTETYLLEQEIFPNLVTQYAKLGDLRSAQEYFNKITSLPIETFSSLTATRAIYRMNVARAKAVLFAAEGKWREANEQFEAIEIGKTATPNFEINVRRDYAWALEKQGREEESKTILEETDRILRKAENEFAHVNAEVNLMAPRLVTVGKEFEMRLDLVNVARKPCVIVRIEGIILPESKVTYLPASFSLQNYDIDTKSKKIGSFQVEPIKLKLKATKVGSYILNPGVIYVDDLGKTRICKPRPVTVTVHEPLPEFESLPDRVPIGLPGVDRLLLGGIPEKHAVALTSLSTDERELLIKKFLETGAKAGETTFNITSEAAATKALAEKYPSNFFLFLCNPQADTMVHSAPNVFRIKGVENLTEIDIALTKSFRTLNLSTSVPRRICIDIVSDVLLQHHAVNTRRWLSALLPTLKSKGFTILAVVDPSMHPVEELQAILSVFDGEIRVTEKETQEGIKQMLRVRKLLNQKYLENEIVLSREKLS